MNGIDGKYNWYAVYTITNHEKRVHDYLISNGIESYLPLIKTLKQWSDRKKWLEEPLFPSYIFVKVSNREYYNVLSHPSSLKYVSFESKPAVIPEKQIEGLKNTLESNFSFEKSDQTFAPGQIVEISDGPFFEYSGEVINYYGSDRLILRIESLGSSILVNLPKCQVLERS